MRARVTLNRFPQLRRQLEANAERAVNDTAEAIRASAVQRSRRRTGFLASSWKTDEGAVYSDDPKSVFHEYGTIHMAPQPMATPAAEEERSRFRERMSRLL